MQIVLLGRMESSLRRLQAKNQPTMPGIDRRKFENIAEEYPVGFGILAVDNNVGPSNHATSCRVCALLGSRSDRSRDAVHGWHDRIAPAIAAPNAKNSIAAHQQDR